MANGWSGNFVTRPGPNGGRVLSMTLQVGVSVSAGINLYRASGPRLPNGPELERVFKDEQSLRDELRRQGFTVEIVR